MRKKVLIGVVFLLAVSVIGNVFQYITYNPKAKEALPIEFENANSRDTYFTIHNISEAQKISTGKGVKVGIIDWNFGYEEHRYLYADLVNLTNNTNNYTNGHGNWMATESFPPEQLTIFTA